MYVCKGKLAWFVKKKSLLALEYLESVNKIRVSGRALCSIKLLQSGMFYLKQNRKRVPFALHLSSIKFICELGFISKSRFKISILLEDLACFH